MNDRRRFVSRKSADDITIEETSFFNAGLGVPSHLRASMPALTQRSTLLEKFQISKPSKAANAFNWKKKSLLNLSNFFAPTNGVKSIKFPLPKWRQKPKTNQDHFKKPLITNPIMNEIRYCDWFICVVFLIDFRLQKHTF